MLWLIPIAVLVPLVAGTVGLLWSFDLSVSLGVPVSPGALVVLLLVALYLCAVLARLAVKATRSSVGSSARSSAGSGSRQQVSAR